MAKLLGGTRIYGTATVDTSLYVGGGLYVNGALYGLPADSPYTTATYVTSYTPITNTNVRIITTGTLTINAPSSGVDGDMVRMWITASGTNTCTVSVNTATIKIPRTSAFYNPQTIISGEKARLAIQYDAVRSVWELVTFVNGY
jgi:hypothetical protein